MWVVASLNGVACSGPEVDSWRGPAAARVLKFAGQKSLEPDQPDLGPRRALFLLRFSTLLDLGNTAKPLLQAFSA
jgi:hypothetical protein